MLASRLILTAQGVPKRKIGSGLSHLPLRLCLSCHSRPFSAGLMDAAPRGPSKDERPVGSALSKPPGNTADLLNDQWIRMSLFGSCRERLLGGRVSLGTGIRERCNARITSETWRCQPCWDVVSLWSRPDSFLEASNKCTTISGAPLQRPGLGGLVATEPKVRFRPVNRPSCEAVGLYPTQSSCRSLVSVARTGAW